MARLELTVARGVGGGGEGHGPRRVHRDGQPAAAGIRQKCHPADSPVYTMLDPAARVWEDSLLCYALAEQEAQGCPMAAVATDLGTR
jgi:hypothetical protein